MQEAKSYSTDDMEAPVTCPDDEGLKDRIKDNYLRVLRKIGPKRGTRVRLSARQVAKNIEWSQGRGSVITLIPPINEPHIETVETYPVLDPYSYIRITFNNNTSEYFLEPLGHPQRRREVASSHQGHSGENAWL